MPDPTGISQRKHAGIDRRRFLARLSAMGFAAMAFPQVLYALASQKGTITKEVIVDAEKLAGVNFTDAQRDLMLKGLNSLEKDFLTLRKVPLPNSVPPALDFRPLLPGSGPPDAKASFLPAKAKPASVKGGLESLAFLPVGRLARLLRAGKVKSVDLARMYIDRLKRYDPVLHCVITLTEERAMKQAAQADRELAAGNDRGPLHGIPWGAKDLFAVKGYRTTWGAAPYKNQVIDEDATIVKRLDAAGAVLIAKLSLGALAMGDVWFGGKTRNPWDPKEGSSGSSAGPAAAVAAGLVGFAVGTETLGSIVSPSTRCGCTGLRPTFGRVSRQGAMALAWSMDKIGPICRDIDDCAAVFNAIYGPDGRDGTVVKAPFHWDPRLDVRKLRIGYTKSLFDKAPDKGEEEWHAFDLATLEVLQKLGLNLVPIELPDRPVDAMSLLLTCEAAAAFDDLTRSGRVDELTDQGPDAWPNIFRQGELIPAVEYIQANRARVLAMEDMRKLFSDIDLYVAPTFGGHNLTLTNLTGHPAVVVPNGFRKNGTPTSITFTGDLFREGKALAVARIFQEATDFNLRQPPLMAVDKRKRAG